MKTLEELEKEYHLADRKWRDFVDVQFNMTDEAISNYKNGKIGLRELISQLQDVDKIDSVAWEERHAIAQQITILKIENKL